MQFLHTCDFINYFFVLILLVEGNSVKDYYNLTEWEEANISQRKSLIFEAAEVEIVFI